MAKTKISEFDANPANNTDIDGINLAEGMAPGLVNNAIRQLMAQLKDFQIGSAGDNVTVGGNLAVTGTTTLTGAATLAGRAIDAFPSGTKMLFQQTAAPTGWTKDTTHDNKALRVVSGTAGSGGSVNFTTAFGSQNVGATALTSAQLPGHTHTFSGTGNTGDAGGHTHTGATNSAGNHAHTQTGNLTGVSGPAPKLGGIDNGTGAGSTVAAGAHTHTLSIDAVGNHNHTVSVSGTTSSTGSGDTHTHTLDLAVQYVDIIICTKT
jgi:hypothetical protein